MNKLTFNPLTAALFFIVGISGVSVGHAADVKIGDVFESYDDILGSAAMYEVATNTVCTIRNGATINVLEVEGNRAIVTTSDKNENFGSCPENTLLHTHISILLNFQKAREAQEIEAASIKKMLDRLSKKAKQAE